LPENLTQPADTFVGEERTIPKIKRLRHLPNFTASGAVTGFCGNPTAM